MPAGFTARYLAEEPDDEDEELEGNNEPLEPLLAPQVGAIDPDDLILWERLRCTYAGAMTYLDAGLGLLLDEMRSRGWLDDLHVVFTADRGLALGEHGVVGDCRPWLHDEIVHLPLIVRQPGGVEAGRRVPALTQPSDLAATLNEMFQVAGAAGSGSSWLALLRDEVEVLREQACSRWSLGEEEEWSLRTLEWAFLLPVKSTGRPIQLYAKPEDRWELNNLLQHHLDMTDELEKKLRAHYSPLSPQA